MVRVRARISAHDGSSQRIKMWEAFTRADIIINKIVESHEAIYLIMENKYMDQLLTESKVSSIRI